MLLLGHLWLGVVGVTYTPERGKLWATPPAAPLETEIEEWVEERGLVRAELCT